jgi:(R)-2-hydroxyacyl-CoA dehydratese activating ATPase
MGEMVITAGIDIGSITTKAALVEDGRILCGRIDFTGYNSEAAGKSIFTELLEVSGVTRDRVARIVATGYGRNSVTMADRAVTEITCHAAGAYFLNPKIRSIIDIGGQDSKVIVLDDNGKTRDFAMNDKCAAGTGRFLEVMARALESNLDEFGVLSLEAESPSPISSMCTVFAESEVISLISKGESRKNIIAGIHESIATRVAAMANRVGLREPVMMTGGVARNVGLVKALEKKLGMRLEVNEYAQLNGAIGAAVIAARE